MTKSKIKLVIESYGLVQKMGCTGFMVLTGRGDCCEKKF